MKHKPLTLTVITDTHYFSPKIGTEGSAYDTANSRSQKLLAQSAPLLEAAFAQIAADKRTDIVLIAGDVTNDGELCSHMEFIELLRSLRARGKRLFVITATHDYDERGTVNGYRGDEIIRIPAVRRHQLFEMYREFGPDVALSVHRESMSYAAQLAPGYRLLALNDDGPFVPEQRTWIEEQARDAHAQGDFIFAMTHHPVIAPSPMYELIGKGDIDEEHRAFAAYLADLNIPLIFTGHTHTHNIGRGQSPRGNVLYAVSTASLVGYPAAMRSVTLDPAAGEVRIRSELIHETVSFDLGGKTLQEYLEAHLTGVIRDMIFTAAEDVDALAYKAVAISIPPRTIYRHGWFIKPLARRLCRLKVKTAGRWTRRETGLRPADYADIADELVVNHVIQVVLALFSGSGDFPPDGAYYKITVGMLNIIDSVLEALRIDLGKLIKVRPTVRELIEPLLYPAGIPSYDAVLPLYPFLPEGESCEALPPPSAPDTVKPSRKGKGILCAAAAVGLLGLPVWAPVVCGSYLRHRIKYGKKMRE